MLGNGDQRLGPAASTPAFPATGPRAFPAAAPERLWRDPYGDPYGPAEPPEQRLDLTRYWLLFLKYRWVILASFVVSLAIGIGATLLVTPIYRAEGMLQIDRETTKVINESVEQQGDQMLGGEEFFQTQYGLLKSRSLAVRVIDSLGLAADDRFLERMGETSRFAQGEDGKASSQASDQQRRRKVIKVFEENLGVVPIRGSRLVKLTFSSPDPALAAQIVNATAENFIGANLDRKFDSSSYARKFLEERLAEYKAKLEDSDRQLSAYAIQQQIINVPAGGGLAGSSGQSQSLNLSSLVALNNALQVARGERIKAEQRWRQAQVTPGQALPEVLQNPTVQELSQTKAKLESEYQDKLQVYKPDFPEMQQIRARVTQLDTEIRAATQDIQNSLRAQFEIAMAQERDFERQVGGLKSAELNLRNRTIQYDILQRESDTNRNFYEGLLQRYKEIGVAGGVTTNNISIVDRADPPPKPAKPRPLLNLAIAAIVGLVAGIILAFVIELLDESISTPEAVEAKLGLPLLGAAPKLERGEVPRTMLDDVRSPLSEAYYSIRTALQFSTAEGAPSSLVVTSARPSEGKSTTALAIAKNFARIGMRVLLVDGDLRNPSMHKNLGAENSAGFSNYLTAGASIADVVQRTDTENMSFIPCGPLPPNPAELLAGGRLRVFLDEAKTMYDIIVIDGPPVMGLADAPLLAATVVGTVFVIEAGATRRGLARTAIRRLLVGQAHLLGVVLTKFNAKKASYGAGYAYAYDYEYGDRPRLTKK